MTSSILNTTLLVLIAVAITPGCVRLKDKSESEGVTTQIIGKSLNVRNMAVDEPYYLVQGELIREKQFKEMPPEEQRQASTNRVQQEMHFDHLVFKPGGVIYILGNSVRIYVQDVDSNGGQISTFPKDRTAALGVVGASGGTLYLNIQHGRGDLQLLMVGEKGGQGLKGTTGAPGADGPFAVKGLFAGCVKGQIGEQGFAGMSGGSSGQARIEIMDGEHFDFSYQVQGGLGGDGGAGGDGGFAGPNDKCRVLDELNRDRGDVGPTGAKGPAGPVENICLQKGHQPEVCE